VRETVLLPDLFDNFLEEYRAWLAAEGKVRVLDVEHTLPIPAVRAGLPADFVQFCRQYLTVNPIIGVVLADRRHVVLTRLPMQELPGGVSHLALASACKCAEFPIRHFRK
jgi:hypothetical protein